MSAALSMTFTPPQITTPGRYLVSLTGETPAFRQEFSAEYSLLDLFIEPSRRALLTPAALCSRLAAVARLLDVAHQEGLVHRNLHPAAILWDELGALALHHWEHALSLEQAGAETSASMIGAPGYMPPEQVRKETRFEPRSDLFSLGAILYEGLTGKAPFEGKNALEMGLATLEKEATPVHEVVPSCPLALSLLCEKLLEKNPSDRMSSALELAEALELLAKDAAPLESNEEALADTMDSTPGPALTVSENLQPSGSQRSNASQPSPFMSASQVERLSQMTGLPQVSQESYEVLSELGRGGLGRVNCAQDKRLQRVVAVKELLRHNHQAKERFLREAMLTARLQHPGIIPIYEAGVWPSGEFFYSMKMVQGEPLDKLIARHNTLEERLGLLPQLLAASEAMAYAHSQKIIHRDLKPANILIGEYGETLVIDWGLAKDLAANDAGPDPINDEGYRAPSDTGLTIDGAIMGTPAYMPPEQAKGKPVDERADVYSLGAILYHMLAGASPYQGRNSRSVLLDVAQGKLIPLEEKQQGTPKDLLAIVKKAMDIDAERRYPTADAFAKDLKKFLTGQLVEAYQYTTSERLGRWFKKNKAMLSVAAASLAVLTGVGGYSLFRVYEEQEQKLEAQKKEALAEAEKLRLSDEKNKKLEEETQKQAIAIVKSELVKNPENALKLIDELPPSVPESLKQFWREDAYSRGVPRELTKYKSGDNFYLKFAPDGKSIFTLRENESIQRLGIDGSQMYALEAKAIHFALSPSGSLLVSAGADGKALLWNTERGELQRQLFQHQGPLYQSMFSLDEKMIAFSTLDSNDILVSLTNDTKIVKLTGQSEKTISMRFSPDGKWFASGSSDNDIYLWDLDSCIKGSELCSPVRILHEHKTSIRGVRFTPDGKSLISVDDKGVIICYDIQRKLSRIISNRIVSTNRIELSPNGNALAVSTVDGIYLWDIYTSQYRLLPGLRTDSIFLVFSEDGEQLVAGDASNNIWLWSVRQERVWVLKGSEVAGFSPDGRLLASIGADGRALLWDIESLQGRIALTLSEPATKLQLSADGEYLATASKNGKLELWRQACLKNSPCTPERSFTIDGEPSELRFSVGGLYLAEINLKGNLYLQDLRRDLPEKLLESGAINLNFSPVAEILAVATGNKTIELWDLEHKQHYSLLGHQDVVTAVTFSPDGRFLASACADGSLFIWDLSTREIISRFQQDVTLVLIEWSPSGKVLAVADVNFGLSLLPLAGEEPSIQKMIPIDASEGNHGDSPNRLAFSPDGKQLLAVGYDQSARLWELANEEGRPLPSMLIGAWLGDGSLLFSTPDGAVRVQGHQ
jgi:serine/threonine protein kinase